MPLTVILSEAKDPRICIFNQIQRFLAAFTLSEMQRSFASLRMTAKDSE
jgi:hypothetical protein